MDSALICAVLLLGSLGLAADVELVAHGRPTATIVLRAQAPADGPERTAAGELQHFVETMSGAQLPVASAGGPVEGVRIALQLVPGAPHPRHDGYWLHVQDGHVLIEATQPRGLLFGAYGLLRQLGCRWYGPTDIGVV
ncbi:MAG: alpha-glucuronidase family glycosyl hydrolase, partial [Armatimonadota bacterium]